MKDDYYSFLSKSQRSCSYKKGLNGKECVILFGMRGMYWSKPEKEYSDSSASEDVAQFIIRNCLIT